MEWETHPHNSIDTLEALKITTFEDEIMSPCRSSDKLSDNNTPELFESYSLEDDNETYSETDLKKTVLRDTIVYSWTPPEERTIVKDPIYP